MAADDFDPGGNSASFGPSGMPAGPASVGASDFDPGGPPRPILGTSFEKVPTAANPAGSMWRSGSLKERLVDMVTSPGQPVTFSDGRPMGSPELFSGVGRGVRDVLDTGAEGLAWLASKVPGTNVDLEGLRRDNKTGREAWEKEHGKSDWAAGGRIGGQVLGTAPITGGIGSLVGRGVAALPGALRTAGQFITGAVPAAGAARVPQLAAQGAGSGALQSALTASAYDQPLGEQVATGAAVGGIAGPAIGGLTKAVDVLRGYSAGLRPEIAALADRARALGVNVPLGSMSSNPFLRMVADVGAKLPFSGADAASLAARRRLQQVAAGEAGSTTQTFGPAEFGAIRDDIRQGYRSTLAQVPHVSGGAPLVTDLGVVASDAARATNADTLGFIGRAIREVTKEFAGGRQISSTAYKALTASDGPLARIEQAAPGAAQPYLGRIRDALRDRLIASSPSPEIAAQLTALDRRYRAMKTLQPLVEKSTTGDIALGGLQQQVINQSRRFDGSTSGKAYTGGGLLGEVGDIGKQFFGHIPDSGTAARLSAFQFSQHPIATTLAAIPGLTVNTPLQAYLRSPTVAGRVIDTSLGGATPDIARALPLLMQPTVDKARELEGSRQRPRYNYSVTP